MKLRMISYVLAMGLLASSPTHAAWTGFSLDAVNAPLADNLNITGLGIFAVPGTITLSPATQNTALYSFTNALAVPITDFHMSLTCTVVNPPDPECDAGQGHRMR